MLEKTELLRVITLYVELAKKYWCKRKKDIPAVQNINKNVLTHMLTFSSLDGPTSSNASDIAMTTNEKEALHVGYVSGFGSSVVLITNKKRKQTKLFHCQT